MNQFYLLIGILFTSFYLFIYFCRNATRQTRSRINTYGHWFSHQDRPERDRVTRTGLWTTTLLFSHFTFASGIVGRNSTMAFWLIGMGDKLVYTMLGILRNIVGIDTTTISYRLTIDILCTRANRIIVYTRDDSDKNLFTMPKGWSNDK